MIGVWTWTSRIMNCPLCMQVFKLWLRVSSAQYEALYKYLHDDVHGKYDIVVLYHAFTYIYVEGIESPYAMVLSN